MKSKPDCYKCVHRRDLPGDAHSCCVHPKAGGGRFLGKENHLASLMAILATARRTLPVVDRASATFLGIVANPHGIKNGWFNWPFNFDPVWLEECEGFTEKEAA